MHSTVIRSATKFQIADYIKLDDPKLIAIIKKVDAAGPGASLKDQMAPAAKPATGKPGEWSVDSSI